MESAEVAVKATHVQSVPNSVSHSVDAVVACGIAHPWLHGIESRSAKATFSHCSIDRRGSYVSCSLGEIIERSSDRSRLLLRLRC